eukprot:CAMPEP_0177235258 /NCGR_PEP_ID=MMETSP0367-20130122/44831_1 /TAXON_ID=447022 ORGANISM="Scrippsiella hangoei-like, Strain SHHI-4" /NCGR_SAMPLE_ID=MMETSP0367 /ASSEMBLY_ACC=CAM_ASM_000362 /LENGTH=86 /DNA_ID=CAMNT_0018686101 /DNA_START=587 /DNA_END=848 /DNA_ORIENTATION=+
MIYLLRLILKLNEEIVRREVDDDERRCGSQRCHQRHPRGVTKRTSMHIRDPTVDALKKSTPGECAGEAHIPLADELDDVEEMAGAG